MSRNTESDADGIDLEDAVASVEYHIASGLRMRDFKDELRLLLAAARVVLCRECHGTGRIHIAVADTTIDCRKCATNRRRIGFYGKVKR